MERIKSKLPSISLKALILLGCFTFTSCSLVGLGYRYADWLIKRRIMEVVKFYSPQQDRLEAILDDYMDWHEKKMLPRYQEELDKVTSRIEEFGLKNKAITSKEVYDFLMMVRGLYLDSFNPLVDRVGPLLSELGPEQVERSRTLIQRKLSDVKEKAEMTKEDYRKEMLERWEDNLVDWFGSVTDKQKQMVNANLDAMINSPKARFARAGQRTQAFLAIFEENKDKTVRTKKLKTYFDSWSDQRPYDKWRQEVSSFMAQFLGTLSSEQKMYFLEKVKGWQKSIRELRS